MMQIAFNELVEGLGDAVMVSDADGEIVYWNAAAERIFGFSAEEAVGRSLDIIIPERQRERHWAGYFHTLETGVTRYGSELLKVPALNSAGERLSIAFTVSLLKDPQGRAVGVVAVVRDETERYREERRLKNRLAELESDSDGADKA